MSQGIKLQNQSEFSNSIKFFYKGLSVAKELSLSRDIGICYENIGYCYFHLFEYSTAMMYYDSALAIYKEISDEPRELEIFNKKGVLLIRSGQYAEALTNYFDVSRLVSNSREKAQNYINVGILLRHIGDHQRSLDYFSKALEIVKGFETNYEQAIYMNLGTLFIDLNDSTTALSYYDRALDMAKKKADSQSTFEILTNTGVLYGHYGNWDKALQQYSSARKFLSKDQSLSRFLDMNEGEVYYRKRDYNKALQKLKYASVRDQESSSNEDLFNRLRAYIRLADIFNALGNYSKALEYSRHVLTNQRSKEIPNIEFLSRAYLACGESLEGLNRNPEAAEIYFESIKLTESVRGNLKDHIKRQNFFATRLRVYENMIQTIHRLSLNGEYLPDSLSKFGADYSEVAWYFAEKAKARSFVEILADARYKKKLPLLSESLTREENRLLDLLSQLEQETEKYFELSAEQRLRLQSRIAETSRELNALINHIRSEFPEYATLRYPQTLSINEIPLTQNEFILEYKITNDATFLFLVRSHKVEKFIRIPITRETLKQRVSKLRLSCDNINRGKVLDFETAHYLYELLIAPVENYLKPSEHLIIVPDEILYSIPFEALVIQADQKESSHFQTDRKFKRRGITYVGEKWDINYYQSVNALAANRSNKGKSDDWKHPIFAAGDPSFEYQNKNSQDVPDQSLQDIGKSTEVYRKKTFYLLGDSAKHARYSFVPLKNAGSEILGIARLYGEQPPSPHLLLEADANEDNIKNKDLSAYQYIHFATHGVLGKNLPYLRQPALIFSPTHLAKEDGFLTMDEIFHFDLNADLVTLSACNSGLGQEITGEGIIGLTRAFMHAGASSVLVSLWSVSDPSTAAFMKRFYLNLKRGMSKAKALRETRVWMLEDSYHIDKHGNVIKHEHPYYWAPFILIGEEE